MIRLQDVLALPDGVGADAVEVLLAVSALYLVSKVVGIVLSLVQGLYRWLLRPAVDPTTFGAWAVVSGASDGIGRAYACELARKKMNVILIARSQDKLDQLAGEIQDKYKVETQVIPADLCEESAFNTIKEKTKDLDVGVVVNCAGLSYAFPEYLTELLESKEAWRVDAMVKLNVASVTKMTSIFLPAMAEKKRGAIVNVSSGFALYPMGLLSVYSASKMYVNQLTLALAQEYRGKGVHFQSLMPNFVSSAMSKMRPSLFVPKPESYVRSAVATLGQEEQTSGFMWHDLQIYILASIPQWLLLRQAFPFHLGIRKKALRRAERLAKENSKTK